VFGVTIIGLRRNTKALTHVCTFAVLIMAVVVSSACRATATTNDSAHAMVAKSIAIVGIHGDLRALGSMKVTTQYVDFDIVENDHSGPPYYAAFGSATITEDFPNHRVLTETTSPAGVNRMLQTRDDAQTIQIRGGKQSAVVAAVPLPSWETRNPVRALLLADLGDDLVRDKDVVWHDALQHVVRFHNGRYAVKIFIDAFTYLPTATEAVVDFHQVTSTDVAWNAWGDVVERTEYMNWNIVDGIRYPFQWDISRNGDVIRTITITEAHTNVLLDTDAFALLPETSARVAALRRMSVDDLPLGQPVEGAPAPNRPTAEIAPGIVQIPNSWYVTLVRQSDGIVVIDAPISAGYSRRVFDKAARRFPAVPIKAVITSTGFFWHMAGVREYAARGIPIYVCDRNVDTLHRLLAAPHTLRPDDLARKAKVSLNLHPVSARTVIGAGHNMLVLFPIRQATQSMVMTYIPDAHLLHTAEAVLPLGPNGSFLSPESLLEISYAVRDAGITVDQIIGMHMSPTPWSKVADTLHASGL